MPNKNNGKGIGIGNFYNRQSENAPTYIENPLLGANNAKKPSNVKKLNNKVMPVNSMLFRQPLNPIPPDKINNELKNDKIKLNINQLKTCALKLNIENHILKSVISKSERLKEEYRTALKNGLIRLKYNALNKLKIDNLATKIKNFNTNESQYYITPNAIPRNRTSIPPPLSRRILIPPVNGRLSPNNLEKKLGFKPSNKI